MWIIVTLIALGLLAVALVALVCVNRLRLDRTNAELVAGLLAECKPPSGAVFRLEDLQGLPSPVQRYLSKVIPEGQPYVKSVRLHQVGEFRLGDASAPWKPLKADQHFSVNPPGFVWEARINMAPLVQARVVDMYKGGEGALRAKVFSTLTVADARGRPELNSGELMRYLAESPWFPTVLLPGQGVTWSSIDDHSAKATIEHAGTTASIVFFFNERDEVERVHSEARFREVEGGYEPTPWTGYWRNYQDTNGFFIPIEGEVEWNLPQGNLAYLRVHLDEIVHDLTT